MNLHNHTVIVRVSYREPDSREEVIEKNVEYKVVCEATGKEN